MDRTTQIAVAIGGNMGNRLRTFQETRCHLRVLGTHFQFSSIYETAPVDSNSQSSYFNAVIRFRTHLDAQKLHTSLQELENKSGRIRRNRNEDRPLDLDLLLFGDQLLETSALMVPHPRMTHRLFVMLPLLEVWPQDFILPGSNITLGSALMEARDLDQTSRPKKVYDNLWGLTSDQDTCPPHLPLNPR